MVTVTTDPVTTNSSGEVPRMWNGKPTSYKPLQGFFEANLFNKVVWILFFPISSILYEGYAAYKDSERRDMALDAMEKNRVSASKAGNADAKGETKGNVAGLVEQKVNAHDAYYGVAGNNLRDIAVKQTAAVKEIDKAASAADAALAASGQDRT